MVYGSDGAASIFTCSQDSCSCSHDSKCFENTVAVYKIAGSESGTEKEGCKIGDAVKVSRGDEWTLIVYELEVFSDEGKLK